MRGLNLPAAFNRIFSLLGIIHTGQSLSTGDYGTPPLSTANVGNNLRLFDSTGTYNTSTPSAGTLSLVPLMSPMRSDIYPGGGGNVSEYPVNIGGESPEIAMANTLAHLLSEQFAATCVGQGGAAMSVIQKGGTGNAYNAALYEAHATYLLNIGYKIACSVLTHGEADATVAVATYQSEILALQSNFNTDLKAITGQSGNIPMLVSQQNSFPFVGGGINNSCQAQVNAIIASSNIIGVCPKYQFSFQGDRAHLSNSSYVLLGEKYAEALYNYIVIGDWLPLIVTNGSITGTNTATLNINVPFGPLQWDVVNTAPHGNATTYGNNGSVFGSPHTGWTAGKGFELWSGGYNGTPIGITSCNISGNNIVIVGVSGFDTVAYAMTPDNTTGGTYTGGFPDGRCGNLMDSDTFAGLSGTVQTNRLFAFVNNVSAFDPSELTDLSVWYRGDSVITSAGQVSQLTDKSGHGRHAVQATSINQPTYSSSDTNFNNMPSVGFPNGGNQAWLKYNNGSVFLNSPITLYFVFSISITPSSGNILADGVDTSNRVVAATYPGLQWLMDAGSLVSQSSTATLNQSYACAWVYNGSTSAMVYVSGKTAQPITTSAGTSGLTGITIGGEQSQASGFNHNGKICEAIYCSTAHSSATVATVLAYLGNRYSITIAP